MDCAIVLLIVLRTFLICKGVMSSNFQLCGNMPDAREALKTSLSDEATVPK